MSTQGTPLRIPGGELSSFERDVEEVLMNCCGILKISPTITLLFVLYLLLFLLSSQMFSVFQNFMCLPSQSTPVEGRTPCTILSAAFPSLPLIDNSSSRPSSWSSALCSWAQGYTVVFLLSSRLYCYHLLGSSLEWMGYTIGSMFCGCQGTSADFVGHIEYNLTDFNDFCSPYFMSNQNRR